MSLRMVLSQGDDNDEQTSPEPNETETKKKPYVKPTMRELSIEEARELAEKHGIDLDKIFKRKSPNKYRAG